MAIFIEPPEFTLGLRLARSGRRDRRFEHYIERTQPEGARSGPGDLDLVSYSLRKRLRLAASGNPTVLLLLFSPEASLGVCSDRGKALRGLADAIVSRRAGPRYLGYLKSQKERMLGVRGQKRVKRPELVEAHGFDTKYAMHVVRLGCQGIELMTTGRLTLPMANPERSTIMAIRRGDWPEDDVLLEIERVERELQERWSRARSAKSRTTSASMTSSSRATASIGAGSGRELYAGALVLEAGLENDGLSRAGEGWFVLNAREARWFESELGFYVQFESESARFDQVGIGLGILRPGEPSGLYHGEDAQEDFLVLSGECLLLIEGEERPLKAWDFVHCPTWTEHIFVGAGDGPCLVLARRRTTHRARTSAIPSASSRGSTVPSVETETSESKGGVRAASARTSRCLVLPSFRA